MSLEETINAEIKTAMLAKDQVALRGLRAIKAGILLAKTEKGASDVLTPEREIQILTKMVKQRKESIEIFEAQNRGDLATTEKEEVAVIERFLPKQMTLEEIKEAIQKIIAETGATSAKDMGKVMGAAKVLAGKADGKLIAETVKNLLPA
jgi:uncharacterized protein YqeY